MFLKNNYKLILRGEIIMITMIIIDDENIIRESLFHFVDWQSIDVKVIGIADNGSSALDLILREKPDIILSDISMPKLSGIELLKLLREKNIVAEVILISAYTDFGYAQSALRYGAYDYILKPIDENLLLETVKKCTLKIYEQNKVKEQNSSISSQKRLLLNSALEKLYFNHTPLNLDEENILKNNNINNQNYSALIAASFYYNAPLTQDMLDSLNSITNSNQLLHVLHLNKSTYLLLLFSKQTELSELKNLFFDFLLVITTNNIFRSIPYIVISNPYSFNDAFTKISSELSLLSMYDFTSSDQPIHTFNDLIQKEPHLTQDQIHLQCKNAIQDNNIKKVEDCILSFIASFVEDNSIYDIDIMKLNCINFIDLLLTDIDSYQLSLYFGDKNLTSKKSIISKDNLGQLYDVTKNILTNITHLLEENRQRSSNRLVNLTLDYIHQNYMNNITLSEIASRLYVSPTYLSMIFSREIGEPFSKYLIRYRIDISKKLLKDPRYKVYEVAEITGFTDIAHFSKVFKSFEGISPRKYANQ